MTDALSTPATEESASADGCGFLTPSPSIVVSVSQIAIQIEPGDYADQATDVCEEGTVVEVEAGDQAFACIDAYGVYVKGGILITLGASGGDDDAALVDALAAMLPEVTVDG